jgi:hypothetical protein
MRTIRFLLLAAAVAAYAQEVPQGGAEQVFVTAIEVVADVRDSKGNVPAGLKPADFVVLEDGIERPVVGVDYLDAQPIAGAIDTSGQPAAGTAPAPKGNWQNVIYFETTLANGPGRVTAAREMMKHVDTLVQMGTVDVVFANPIPTALVRNSRDAAAIRAALEKVAASSGTNQLAAQRREYLRDAANLRSISALKSQSPQTSNSKVVMDYGSGSGGTSSTPTTSSSSSLRGEFDSTGEAHTATLDTNSLRPYIDQEIRMINSFRESLMSWLSSYRKHTPRNLLLVSDGFDLDPAEFYGGLSSGKAQAELKNLVSQSSLGSTGSKLAEALAAGAWTAISIPSDNNADGWVDDSTVSAIGRVHAGTVNKRNTSPRAFLLRPLDPLNAIADATGGKVVPNSAGLGAAIEGLDDKIKITYQVDRKPDGKTRKVQVRARDANLKVHAAKFAASTTPEELASARALGLLKNATYGGDLATEGAVDWAAPSGPKKSGTLRAVTKVDLVKQILPPGAKGQFRITLAVQLGKEAVVVNRAVPDYDLGEGVFRFRTPLDLPANATAVVLVIEETTTGAWGSTRVDVPASATPAS